MCEISSQNKESLPAPNLIGCHQGTGAILHTILAPRAVL